MFYSGFVLPVMFYVGLDLVLPYLNWVWHSRVVPQTGVSKNSENTFAVITLFNDMIYES